MDIIKEFRDKPSTSVADALSKLGINGISYGVMPVLSNVKIVGYAITIKQAVVQSGGGKRRTVQIVDEIAKPGDVIIIDADKRLDTAACGGNLALRAKIRGIEGIVIEGSTRDVSEIREMRFPVFARGVIPGSPKHLALDTISVNEPVTCGSVQVRPGDLVVGDEDGLVFVPKDHISEVLELVNKREIFNKMMVDLLKQGKTSKEAIKESEEKSNW